MTLNCALNHCNNFKRRIVYNGFCLNCGKFFFCFVRDARRGRYSCSRGCIEKKGSNVNCANCNKQIYRMKDRLKRYKKHFCGDSCLVKYMRGKNAANYKGGYILNGYKIISINSNSIPEHRYIMEQNINRKLKPFENVHHLNGIRSDNRIENLELWCKPQSIGQRVSDLVKFVCMNYPNEVDKYRLNQCHS